MDISTLDIQAADEGVLFKVKVVPGSSRDGLVGVMDGALKAAVSAPPEKGRANKALIKLLAAILNLRKNQISICSVETSPHKTIHIDGLNTAELMQRLSIVTRRSRSGL